MGREVRMVPPGWEHPKDHNGNHKPLLDGCFEHAAEDWKQNYEDWKTNPEDPKLEYWEWDGPPPEREDYMPKWEESECTHYQMYENTSEGTPKSPPMETPELLAQWLADNNASTFADHTTTYEKWLAMIKEGYAPSLVMTISSNGAKSMQSGVEFATQEKKDASKSNFNKE